MLEKHGCGCRSLMVHPTALNLHLACIRRYIPTPLLKGFAELFSASVQHYMAAPGLLPGGRNGVWLHLVCYQAAEMAY
eukprot:2291218-Heterocapsa_arctica.AAC.1